MPRFSLEIVAAATLLVGATACSHEATAPTVLEGIASEERAAVQAIFGQAQVDAAHVVAHDDLYGFSWRGGESYAKQHGRLDRAEAIRKRRADVRDAIAVDGGHVVALRLSGTKLKDVSVVSKLTHLVVLDLHDSQIDNANGLSALAQLDHLDLAGNRLASLAQISGLPMLRSLNVADNPLDAIDGLDALPKLEVLNLAASHISKIENLGKLGELRALSLAENPIDHIEGLEQNGNLEDLNLSYCQITRIEHLSALKKLHYLNLWHNKISKIAGVEEAPSLGYVGLGENPYEWDDPRNRELLASFSAGRLLAVL